MDPLQIAGTITTATGLAAFVVAHVLQSLVRNDEKTIIDSLRSPRIPPGEIAKLLKELKDAQKIEGLKQMMGGEISAATLGSIARRQSSVQVIRIIGVLVVVLSITLFAMSDGGVYPVKNEPVKFQFTAAGWDNPAGPFILQAEQKQRGASMTFSVPKLEANAKITDVELIKMPGHFSADSAIDPAPYVDITEEHQGRSIKFSMSLKDDPRAKKEPSWVGIPIQSFQVPFIVKVTVGTE